jgi:hypothetical protein
MNKEKVLQFLNKSLKSTWADEMQCTALFEYELEFNCANLISMIESRKLSDDVKKFLSDSSNNSTWVDIMLDSWMEEYPEDDSIISCEILLSFME